MNTYEIERKLGDKADKWELHGLQTENRELKSHMNELERKIGELQSVNSNRYYALEGLFNLIAEHPQFSDLQNEVYQLKQNL
jgi:cell division septum initiation protein DivIVA